jgi:hypothetical protein
LKPMRFPFVCLAARHSSRGDGPDRAVEAWKAERRAEFERKKLLGRMQSAALQQTHWKVEIILRKRDQLCVSTDVMVSGMRGGRPLSTVSGKRWVSSVPVRL